MKRLLTGLLLASLWVPIATAIYVTLFWYPPDFIRNVDQASWIEMAALIGALLGFFGSFAVGLPAHIILRRRNYRSLWAYLTIWFTLAIMLWLVGFVASFARDGLLPSFLYLADTIIHRPYVPVSFAIVWAVVGATFWAIVRPDREVRS